MRVLVLHSDVRADASADELDTLVTAQAVAEALVEQGHRVAQAAFEFEPEALKSQIATARADVVFNLVESVHGDGALAVLAPAMIERLGIAYTGANAACIAATGDKIFSKQLLSAAGVPTPEWSESPHWNGLAADRLYIVKSVTEDASLGLDDAAVLRGKDVPARAEISRERHGGRWFAEAYLEGREFNVALLEEEQGVRVLPIPEMRFDAWPEDRPRIVGYAAKWDDTSEEAMKTVRYFGVEEGEPDLAKALGELARKAWNLFGMRGYARIDFRLGRHGKPMVLEANPNPCLEPNAGFAAAAERAGLSFASLVGQILHSAQRA